jgi:hypothetical protein
VWWVLLRPEIALQNATNNVSITDRAFNTFRHGSTQRYGLASSIVQFIQFGLEVTNRLQELNSTSPGEVPKSLQSISS